LRLTDEQFDGISQEYHDWRIERAQGNRRFVSTAEKRMHIFVIVGLRWLPPTNRIYPGHCKINSHTDFLMDISGEHISFPREDDLMTIT
jgi:hypothetical protein